MFDQHEPIGGERLDFHIARLMTLLANIYRKKDAAAFELEQFLVDWWGDRPGPGTEVDELSEGEQVAFLEVLCQVYGGTDLREKHNGDAG